jgi:hypothetical protein
MKNYEVHLRDGHATQDSIRYLLPYLCNTTDIPHLYIPTNFVLRLALDATPFSERAVA